MIENELIRKYHAIYKIQIQSIRVNKSSMESI